MDPFAKSSRLSLVGHLAVVGVVALCAFLSQCDQNKSQPIFTLVGPPAGAIAGGDLGSHMQRATVSEGTAGPKLAPATQEADEGPSEDASAEEAKAPEPKKSTVIPTDSFVTSVAKKITPPKVEKKVAAPAKPKTMSYADFQKTTPKNKLASAATKKSTASAKKASAAKKSSSSSAIPSSSGADFDSTLANRIARLPSGSMESSNIGTGQGGAAGSGVFGDGIAGATEDPELLYTGAVWTYLNSVWEEPKQLGGLHFRARAEFVVDKSGHITSWKITQGSGSREFDRSVGNVFARIHEVSTPPTPTDYRLSVEFETREQ